MECVKTHAGNKLNADFLGCKGELKMRSFSQQSGVPFDALLAVGDWQTSRLDGLKALAALASYKFQSLSSIFNTLDVQDVNSDVASFWFSCANGCCTADN